MNSLSKRKKRFYMYIVGFNISVSWKFWQPEVNSQCLAMASREHGAVEVDVAVAGGVPGEIFLSCYNIAPNQIFGRYF